MPSVPSNEISFFVNGRKIKDKNVEPETTLLQYLRNSLRLPGTKLGCSEGGCGACTVMLSKYNHIDNKIRHFTANACLTPVCAVDGMAVTTVEGIGSTKTRLHPVQERIAKAHGSQCGFCTPGIVMSMYTLLRNNPLPSTKDMESAFEGNLCRCTGYRAILDGYKTFTKEFVCCGGGNQNGCCMQQTNGTTNGHVTQENISSALFDVKEFQPLDPTQEPIFPPELMLPQATQPRYLHIKGDYVTWIRPSFLEELLELKDKHPQAKLVVGNTEIGLETKFKNQNYPIQIAPTHIPELSLVQETDSGVTFGSSVTLTTIEETLKDVVARLPEYKTRVYAAILEILRWFAGQQIRNVGCIGGNIMTASPISDLNPILMASGCMLTIASVGGKTREIKFDEHFFRGYRKTSLEANEVLVSIHVPFTHQDEYFFAYKQARRRDDDIAIVNAAMRVRLEKSDVTKWVVRECSLCYGGMAPTTAMALKTSKALVGRPWDEKVVDVACGLLEEDLPLSANAPGGQVSYRRSLTTSFFFKFYLMVTDKLSLIKDSNVAAIQESCRSAAKFHEKFSSKSTQTFQEVPPDQSPDDVIGRPVLHLAALKQVTGEAVYIDDMPKYAGELYLSIVLSERAHAKIKSIDVTKATKMPGVRAYVSADDVTGSNINGPVIPDELVFYNDEVTAIGQPICGILAETQAQAQRASKAVKIEYEDLPAIVTVEDAIKTDSFIGPKLSMQTGDLEKGFADCDHVIQGEMRTGAQEHFYLETNATIAFPKGEDGEMELFSSTQNPACTQAMVATALGVPRNRIVVRTKRMGGGFGGKETRACVHAAVVAVAANKVGCPVRCMLDRDEDMKFSGTRHSFLAKYKVGFKKDGTILALDVQLFNNAGHSLDLSKSVMERGCFSTDNCYRIPNLRVVGRCCKTNIPSNTAFRGFGGPQGMMMTESWINDVAQVCKISQRQVREMNFYQEGDMTHFNQKLVGCHVSRVWNELIEKCNYEKRKQDVEAFNKCNRWKKRGIALVPTKFGIAFTATFLNQAGALVHVYTDGSVLITHGGTEMGQGLHTKIVQIASRALGVPVSKIHISETSTNTVPNTSPTAASASSDLNGMAVKIACSQILERLEPIKKKNPEGSWEDWITSAYFDRISLSAFGFYKTPGLKYDWEANTGNPFNYFCYGASCSEVEVDCLTGDHQNLRTDIVMDVGNSLNPAIDIGQVEGGFVQGLGMLTIEEVRFSQKGTLWTTGPGAYKIPGFADIPTEFYVHLLRSQPNEKAVYSSKAVGEPPLFLAASIFYAIKNAVISARRDTGNQDTFRFDSPATSERIRMACTDRFTKQFPPCNDPSVNFNVAP